MVKTSHKGDKLRKFELMIKILEEVAIQLSTTFMRKTVDSVNNLAGKEIVVFDYYMTEFKLMLFNTEYLIRNRAYRDDTNDEDVEEVVFKFIRAMGIR